MSVATIQFSICDPRDPSFLNNEPSKGRTSKVQGRLWTFRPSTSRVWTLAWVLIEWVIWITEALAHTGP